MLCTNFDSWLADLRRPTLVMGIVNATPDSFSDGGRFASPEQAADHALAMIEAGADWLDIGGESTRPGALRVPEEEQIRRTIPVIRAIRQKSEILISIDTTRAAVWQAARDAGANLVNDISAGRDDPEMFSQIAKSNAGIILMHMQGEPATMQIQPAYKNVTSEVAQFLLDRRDAAVSAGIDSRRILLDPGLGFGKTVSHNLRLMADIPVLAGLGHPLVVGPSRKSFIGEITGEKRSEHRQIGTCAACALCAERGANVLRVHDISPVAQTLRMVRAIAGAKMPDFLKS
jgi:dihydropteroate synthase